MKRIALVTGGNRGIGLEVCRQLAQRGLIVILASRDLARGEKAARALHREGLVDVHPAQLDVMEEGSIQGLRGMVEKDFGHLDVLVNNAGIYPDKVHRLLEVDLDLMRHTMDVNAYAPLRLIQVLLPLMKKNNWGRIVNVSSGFSALQGVSSSYPAYRLSKITLNLFTRILAGEVDGRYIKVNSMSPGWVRTDVGGPSAPRSVQEGADTVVWLATLPEDGPHGGFFHDRQPIDW